MTRLRSKPITIGLIALWLVYIGFVFFLFTKTGVGGYDFDNYYRGSIDIVEGNPLYFNESGSWQYLYPPLLAGTFAPFSQALSHDGVAILWFIVNLATLTGAVWLVNRCVDGRVRQRVFWIMPLVFTPVLQSFWVGQVSFVLLFVFTLIWYAYKHERFALVGGLVALAAWLKVYPVFLLVYFLWRRDWRVLRAAMIVGIALGVIQIMLPGPDYMIEYFQVGLPKLLAQGQLNGLFKNSSILGFTQRLFTPMPEIIPLIAMPGLAGVARWALTLLIIGGGAWVVSRTHQQAGDRGAVFDLEYALVIVIALLFGSTLWVSGMPPLLLAYYLLLRHPLVLRMRVLVWLSFSVVSYYFVFLLAFQPGNQLHALSLSIGFYGVILLWGILVILVRKEKTGTPYAERSHAEKEEGMTP